MTGATGFLGRELLARLLAEGREVRGTPRRREDESPGAAEARVLMMIDRTQPGTPVERLSIAFADVREPGLMLDAPARAWLDAGPIQIVHGAAEVRFDL